MFETASDETGVLLTDIGLLLGMLVLAEILDASRRLDRALFGATTAALLVSYAVWRWHDTLPPPAMKPSRTACAPRFAR